MSCITGSDLHTLTGITTLPDARGVFLRDKNNGRGDGGNPDGDLAIGTQQADTFKQHSHKTEYNRPDDRGEEWRFRMVSDGNATVRYFNTGSSGGDETRPKNITVNVFIKINND